MVASSEFTQVEVHQMAERLREEVLTIDRLSMFAQQCQDSQLQQLLERQRDQHAQQYQQMLSILDQHQGQGGQWGAGAPHGQAQGQSQSQYPGEHGQQAGGSPYAGHEPAGYGTYQPHNGNHGDPYR